MMKLENKTNIQEVTQINDVKIVLSNIQELDQEIIKNIKSTDEHLTTELILFIENDFKSYQRLTTYKKSLIKKIQKDIFNYSLSVKGIKNIIDDSIKEYIKLFTNYTKISDFINNNDRLFIYNYFIEKILIDEL